MHHMILIGFTTDHRQFLAGTVTDHDFGEDKAATLRANGFIGDAPPPEPEAAEGEAEAPAEPQEAGEGAEPAPRGRRKAASPDTGEADAFA